MRRRAALGGIVLILAVGIGGYFAVSHVLQEHAPLCRVCGRSVHPGQMFVLQLEDGEREPTRVHFDQVLYRNNSTAPG